MEKIYFRVDGLFSRSPRIECSRKKHIIPTHRPGVPGSHPPRLSKGGRPRVNVDTGGHE